MSTRSFRQGPPRRRPARRQPLGRLEPLEGRLLLSGDTPYVSSTAVLQDIWVDPVHGSDSATGADRAHALQSITAAWDLIPSATPLTSTGYRIDLVAGDYTDASLPSGGWASDRRGTAQAPVEIVSADGNDAAVIHRGLDFQDDSYLALVGLDLVTDPGAPGGGNVVQVAASDHVSIFNCFLDGSDGTTRLAQETLKVNQVQDIWVQGCEIRGAFWFGLDFVAVQYGDVIGNSIHNTGDDALLLKGGTAQILVEGNEVYDAGSTGISAGQGTGFEFMVSPWIHYEAYDIKIINNEVYNIQNAGLAVRGGYNILMADNTLYRVGLDQTSGSGLILVAQGSRSLDNAADAPFAQGYHDAGGWGPTAQGNGSDPGEYIPNKHVFIYNNIVYNPDGVRTEYSQFDIADPVTPPVGWNIPSPSSATDDLQIRGNVIWNGPSGMDLGINDPALAAQVARDNSINAVRPDFVAPDQANFTPVAGGTIARTAALAIPDFPGGDLPPSPLAPAGDLSNAVTLDFDGLPRAAITPPGAIDPNAVPPGSPPPPPPPTPKKDSTRIDFDGDGKADLAVYGKDPATGRYRFKILTSSSGFDPGRAIVWDNQGFGFGNAASTPVAADYFGDGKAAYAIFSPDGAGYMMLQAISSTDPSKSLSIDFGLKTDVPVIGDVDGDGKADFGVFGYDPNLGYRFDFLLSSRNFDVQQPLIFNNYGYGYGSPKATPVVGDFDGSGHAGLGVYIPSGAGGTFTYVNINIPTGTTGPIVNPPPTAYFARTYGFATDTPMAVDYDGDGKSDLAFYGLDPRTGRYRYDILTSSSNFTQDVYFDNGGLGYGYSASIPVMADYEGDGHADFAVYQPDQSGGAAFIFQDVQVGHGVVEDFATMTDEPVSASPLIASRKTRTP